MELYEKLPTLQHGQIRLLNIHPLSADPNPMVECTLSTHDLKGAAEKPDFFALSYTWGPPHYNIQEVRKPASGATRQVACNGKTTDVTENLYEFLHHCASNQDQNHRGYAWIDALCINQHAPLERSQQVKLMGDIYKAASRVVVWLGVEDQSTDSALELMNMLLSLSPEERFKLNPHCVQAEHDNPLLNMPNWKALIYFFQRAWFNRAWIIQEVVFAKTVIVLCGGQSFQWDSLVTISHFLATTSWSSFLKGLAQLEPNENAFDLWHDVPTRLAAAKKTWASAHRDGLLYALIRARSSKCQDRRDKVYSQLGLGEADIFPDYEMPVAEVYVTTARYILEHSESLLLLTCVEGEEFQTIEGLPSWVPDWSVIRSLGLRVTGYRHFNAAAARPRRLTLSMDNEKHILNIEVINIDEVAETCEPKGKLRQSLHATTFWDLVARFSATTPNGHNREEAIWRALMTNRANNPVTGRAEYPAASDQLAPSFRDWILWRYATASGTPTTFPVSSSADSILPTYKEIQNVRRRCLSEPGYLTSLAHRASPFDLHYTHGELLRPFCTKQGYFGTGTQCLREGDSIWIASGCRVPLIARRIEGSERYRLVGGSYVHGIMNGEVLERKDVVFEMVGLE